MTAVRSRLLHQLLAPRMMLEFESIRSLLRKNFDVVARLNDDESWEVFRAMATEESKVPGCDFVLALSLADVVEWNSTGRTKPILCISHDALPVGSGFVEYHLPPALQFLPSLAQVVSQTLTHLRLEAHIDVFDGKRMSQMKDVLRESGISALVDLVVQIAYHAGLEGDDAAANRVLASLVSAVSKNKQPKEKLDVDDPATHARKFFGYLLSGDKDPHAFVKAALSYYVVHGLGHNLSSASRLLKVSRTTVHDHLSLAERSGVEKYFASETKSFGRRNFAG